ncbi:hypothetical protein ACSYAD_29130 [Acaryochloris marina NIES-2412]|uniref:hypothetical protein n=1 Tax=Acaryochloris marina TaxID=155978 RepID=UPI004058D7A0
MSVNQQSTTLYINVDTDSPATRGFALADFGDASPYEFFIYQLLNVAARRVSEYENNKCQMNDRSSLEQVLKKLRDFYDEINSQWAYRALDIWLYLASTRTWGQS